MPYFSTIGGPEFVGDLFAKDITQGILTNRVKMAEERLEQAGYPKMEFILSPKNKEDRKPNPKVFNEALRLLEEKNINEAEILSVGDHTDDFISSRDAGLNFVAVLTGGTTKEEFLALGLNEENIFNNLEELKKIF
jgi:phosphoglycolate phosphatase-like HAD superfamily hydrolase